MKPRRMLLVEDHTIVRAGLRALLEGLDDISVVGEAEDGREALRKVKLFQPDIVMTDLAMPGLNGIEVVERIKKTNPKTCVVVLSMHTSEEYVLRALRAGADGYLVKNAAPQEIGLAIEAAVRGEVFLSPAVSNTVVKQYLSSFDHVDDPLSKLTGRQREILQLLAESKSVKEIAIILNVSVKTVETHRANIMGRLGIADLAGLVRFAIKEGLVDAV